MPPIQFSPLQIGGLILAGAAATSSGAAIILHGESLERSAICLLIAALATGIAFSAALLTAQAVSGRSAARARRLETRIDGIDRSVQAIKTDVGRGIKVNREILDVLRNITADHDNGAPTGPHPIPLYPS